VLRRELREPVGEGLGVRIPARRGRGRLGRGVDGELAAQRPRARPVDRAVDDDPVQPRPERPPAVEAVEGADGGEEGLLRDVLGRGGVVDDEVRGAVGAGPVAPDEGLERARAVYPVRSLRERLGLSQAAFARAFGISVDTLQNWEQGRREPEGPARALLKVIWREPEAAMRALRPDADAA
jgi:putative transcriptional regulator